MGIALLVKLKKSDKTFQVSELEFSRVKKEENGYVATFKIVATGHMIQIPLSLDNVRHLTEELEEGK